MRAKGKGFWKRQIMDAYTQGRVDGASKQKLNYEVGFHLGKSMGREEGRGDGWAEAQKLIPRIYRPRTWSAWERICHGKTDG